jgi:putative ABC transport system permease protein
MQPNGSIRYILIFSFVALLILIIASINYMNLSTARSALRVKEIGVRKVNGSSRGQLITMFLAESVLLTFFAAILAAVLVQACQPLLKEFTGKDTETWHGLWQTSVCGALVFIGCLSGFIRPLFSRFNSSPL